MEHPDGGLAIIDPVIDRDPENEEFAQLRNGYAYPSVTQVLRMSHMSMTQPRLFESASPSGPLRSNAPTFVNNMTLPVHRWFRFSAGYSAEWVVNSISDFLTCAGQSKAVILDPFAGSGTTLLASSALGCDSFGWEAQDFIFRVADAKVQCSDADPEMILQSAHSVIEASKNTGANRCNDQEPKLLQKCYSEETLAELRGLQEALNGATIDMDDSTWKLLWLALVSTLRPASHVGTAQWQYVLPNKKKINTVGPSEGFMQKARMIAGDISVIRSKLSGNMSILQHDARQPSKVPKDSIDIVVTSPPYANNYDYADATRLEMTFLGEVAAYSDLKRVREPLIHACSQHMVGYDASAAIEDPLLTPIVDRLGPIYEELSSVRSTRGGKKAYHAMVVAYFLDMARVWQYLRAAVRPGGKALFVVGDSAPYGVHTPVDELHGELAVAAGFESYRFTKTRDRNIKWKNRKHRVPLKEGVLEVQG